MFRRVGISVLFAIAVLSLGLVRGSVALGEELSIESDSADTVEPVATDSPSNARMLAAPAASTVTLDTVNNNVLNQFGSSVMWWNNYPYPTDDGTSQNAQITLRQWLMLDSVTANDRSIKTLLGYAKDAATNSRSAFNYIFDTSTTLAQSHAAEMSKLNEVDRKVSNLQTGGDFSLDSAQWNVVQSTLQFQNFVLLVLSLLVAASLGVGFWGVFSRGWRR